MTSLWPPDDGLDYMEAYRAHRAHEASREAERLFRRTVQHKRVQERRELLQDTLLLLAVFAAVFFCVWMVSGQAWPVL